MMLVAGVHVLLQGRPLQHGQPGRGRREPRAAGGRPPLLPRRGGPRAVTVITIRPYK